MSCTPDLLLATIGGQSAPPSLKGLRIDGEAIVLAVLSGGSPPPLH